MNDGQVYKVLLPHVRQELALIIGAYGKRIFNIIRLAIVAIRASVSVARRQVAKLYQNADDSIIELYNRTGTMYRKVYS